MRHVSSDSGNSSTDDRSVVRLVGLARMLVTEALPDGQGGMTVSEELIAALQRALPGALASLRQYNQSQRCGACA